MTPFFSIIIPVYNVAPYLREYQGNLFDMADAAIAFVLSKLDLRVGTRNKSSETPREYDIPEEVVAEAIINAIVHRDYSSSASV